MFKYSNMIQVLEYNIYKRQMPKGLTDRRDKVIIY